MDEMRNALLEALNLLLTIRKNYKLRDDEARQIQLIEMVMTEKIRSVADMQEWEKRYKTSAHTEVKRSEND